MENEYSELKLSFPTSLQKSRSYHKNLSFIYSPDPKIKLYSMDFLFDLQLNTEKCQAFHFHLFARKEKNEKKTQNKDFWFQ